MSDTNITVNARGTSRDNPTPMVEVYIPDLEVPLTMTFTFTSEGLIVDAFGMSADGDECIRTFSNMYDEFFEMMAR